MPQVTDFLALLYNKAELAESRHYFASCYHRSFLKLTE